MTYANKKKLYKEISPRFSRIRGVTDVEMPTKSTIQISFPYKKVETYDRIKKSVLEIMNSYNNLYLSYITGRSTSDIMTELCIIIIKIT